MKKLLILIKKGRILNRSRYSFSNFKQNCQGNRDLYKTGETKKVSSLKEKSISLKSFTRELQEQLIEIEKSLIELRIQLPNVPYDVVPDGNSDKDNEEVFKSDLTTESKINYLPHWELGKKYDIIDFELGNKISGAGFPVYKDKGQDCSGG